MARTKTKTLFEYAALQVGRRQAIRAVAFIVCWATAERALKRPPTLEEYADWWGESVRTVFRQQELFRKAFPGETTPQRLVDHLNQNGSAWYKLGVASAAPLEFTLPRIGRATGRS